MLNLLRKFSILLALPLLFTSCDKDDDGEIIDAANLIGTWEAKSISVDWKIEGQDAIQYLKDQGVDQGLIDLYELIFTALEDEELDLTFTFKEDGTLTGSDADGAFEGEWSFDSDENTITIINNDAEDPDEENLTYDVYILSSSNFSFGIEETILEDVDFDGTDEDVYTKFTFNLSK